MYQNLSLFLAGSGPALASEAAEGHGEAAAHEGAEGAHGGGEMPVWELAAHGANLLLLVVVLFVLLKGKVGDGLKNRAAEVKKDIDDANSARKDAQDRVKELEVRLEGFEKELGRMRADAEAAADREAQAIAGRAASDAAVIREAAQRTIRDEAERARHALRAEAVGLAVKLAEERLKGDIKKADQDRLADEFLSSVGGSDRG